MKLTPARSWGWSDRKRGSRWCCSWSSCAENDIRIHRTLTVRLDGRAPGAHLRAREINMTARRTFHQESFHDAIAATASTIGRQSQAQPVSNRTGASRRSSGRRRRLRLSHHIYDARAFPCLPAPGCLRPTPPCDYRMPAEAHGTRASSSSSPRNYAIDNSASRSMPIAQLGPNAMRHRRLHPTAHGDRAGAAPRSGHTRHSFTLATRDRGRQGRDDRAARETRRGPGLHVQFKWRASRSSSSRTCCGACRRRMVFDHLCNPPLSAGVEHPSHAIVRSLSTRPHLGHLSARTRTANRPSRPTRGHRRCAGFRKAAPERLCGGADWPHPTMPTTTSRTTPLLLDLLTEWARTRRRATASWCGIRSAVRLRGNRPDHQRFVGASSLAPVEDGRENLTRPGSQSAGNWKQAAFRITSP